jgi:outer membrane autotransporter protein
MRTGSKGFTAGKHLCTASVAALMLGSSAALAADFTAGTNQQLRDAIAAANASSDASSTITLTGSFALSAVLLPIPTRSITIDTQGFTLTGPAGGNNGALFFDHTGGNTVTIEGNLLGGTGVGGTATGGVGLFVRNTGVASVVVNNGTITGGTGLAAGGRGGVGARIATTTFTNNGTIHGGAGRGVQAGGNGFELLAGTSLTNNSLIEGGSGATGSAGIHVQAAGGSLVNNGTIRGGTGTAGSTSAAGVLFLASLDSFINRGTIEGGTGGAGIHSSSPTVSLSIINSGTIRAGAGSANAIFVASGATNFLTLELQAGSVIEGNVVASAAGSNDVLRLGGASDASFDAATLGDTAQYRNFDTLEKTGASTWTIAGSGDFAGATTVSEGTLRVNGSLANSAVTVASGARLGGSGTVGATTLAAGGRIAPGNSIGTLTVNGAYLQNAGAVYEVEVDPGTATSDRIQVNGAAALAAGAAISVINYTGAGFVAGQRYTILTSAGLTGDYGADIAIGPILSLRNSTDAGNAYLTVVQTGTAGGIGGTPNEAAVGGGIDSLPTGNAVQTGLYNQATLEAARRALGQLAGEIHASARTVLLDESWLLRAAVNDRLRSAFGAVGASPMATLNYGFTADLAPAVKGPMPKPPAAERFAVWGQGYGSWGRIASDGNAASLTRSTGGLLVGADAAVFDNLRLGVVAGYSRSEFDVNRRLASGESDNYHLGLYGGGQWGALSLRTGLSYTWHDLSTRRGIVAAGLGDTLRADYDAGTAQAFGELGYRIDLGQSALGQVALEPFAGLAYVVLNSDRFTERGGAAALSAGSGDTSLGYTTLGLRAATTTRLAGMDVTLRGGLGWRHAFGDVDPKTTLAFSGGTPFSIAGLPIAENAALVEAGLDIALGANATLGASYTSQLAEDAQDHAFKANLAVRF